MSKRLRSLQETLRTEFGWKSKLASGLGGMFVYLAMKREASRLKRGATSEPPTFYESNYQQAGSAAEPCRWVEADSANASHSACVL